MSTEPDRSTLTGGELVRVLAALSNPQRLRILAALVGGSVHVSQLAREIGLGRPLVHMHLQRLEAAGLVTGRLEISDDGKAMRFYDVMPFAVQLTPDTVVAAARMLDTDPVSKTSTSKETS